jgi:hypothetical protein
MTGMLSAAYQPLGYGPPDYLSITVNNVNCAHANPSGFRDTQLGVGRISCGNNQDIMNFYGDSNAGSGNLGRIEYNDYYQACTGHTASYAASFSLNCAHDSGNNATCTASLPITLVLTAVV